MLDLSKSIIRVIKRKIPFFQINKALFNDTRLSLQAKGLMMLILSLPDTWEFNETFFNLANNNDPEEIYSGIDELIRIGYIILIDSKDNGISQLKTNLSG